jgi:biopolymer transport protein ExbD
MAQALGTDQKNSVNVDVNIIPFIDLMSCLTAFLLVAAVWVNIAQLQNHPQGKARDVPPCLATDDCDPPTVSVLLEGDDIWVGVSRVDDFQRIPKNDKGYDWSKLEDILRTHRQSPQLAERDVVELAAASTNEHPIDYQSLVAAMDIAVKAGWGHVGVTEPRSLSAQPHL